MTRSYTGSFRLRSILTTFLYPPSDTCRNGTVFCSGSRLYIEVSSLWQGQAFHLRPESLCCNSLRRSRLETPRASKKGTFLAPATPSKEQAQNH